MVAVDLKAVPCLCVEVRVVREVQVEMDQAVDNRDQVCNIFYKYISI